MSKPEKDIAFKVMEEIKKDNITMYPPIYFAVAAIFLSIGAIGLLIATSFLANVVLFYFRSKQPFQPLWREELGWGLVLSNIPWLAIVLALLAMGIGLKLLHHFAPLYKRRTSELVVGIVIVAILGGVALDYIGVNEPIHHRQGMKRIYSVRDKDERWLDGKITDIKQGGMEINIQDPSGQSWQVQIDPMTKIPAAVKLQKGNTIHIIARCEEDQSCFARAIGLRMQAPSPVLPQQLDQIPPIIYQD